jgi:hypothetical protein
MNQCFFMFKHPLSKGIKKAAPHLPRKRLCAAILLALLLGNQELGTEITGAMAL